MLNTNQNVTTGVSASAVYAGSAIDLCHEETLNAFIELGEVFVFSFIAIGLTCIFWKESLYLLKKYKIKK